MTALAVCVYSLIRPQCRKIAAWQDIAPVRSRCEHALGDPYRRLQNPPLIMVRVAIGGALLDPMALYAAPVTDISRRGRPARISRICRKEKGHT
jgi:hypothetical protein